MHAITFPASMRCGKCGTPYPMGYGVPNTIGSVTEYGVIACGYSKCSEYEKQYKVLPQIIQLEAIDG